MNEKLRVYIRICRVFLYELMAWSYIVSHQHGEDIVYVGGIVNCATCFRIRVSGVHCCFPQLFGIHLTPNLCIAVYGFRFLVRHHILNECLACFFGVTVFTDFFLCCIYTMADCDMYKCPFFIISGI